MNKKFDLFRKKEKEKLLENKEEVENIINEKSTTKAKILFLIMYLMYPTALILEAVPNLEFSEIDTITTIVFLFLSWYGWSRGNKYALIGIIILTINFSKYIILEHYFISIIIIIFTTITVFYYMDKAFYKRVFYRKIVIEEIRNKKYNFLYLLLLPFTSSGARYMFFEAHPFAEYILIFLLGGFCAAMFDIGSMRELKRKIRKINKRESNDKI